MAERTAIVVGAGVGGLSAALALQRAGWGVTVFERRGEDGEAGSGISLWPNALRALADLDVDGLVTAGAALGGNSGVRTPQGRWVARTNIGGAIADRHGLPLVLIHRQRLLTVLRERLSADRIHHEVEVQHVSPTPSGATVVTTEGTHAADLVVTADGARSRTRADLFPDHPGLRYSGYTTWRMIVPAPDAIQPSETWGTGGRRFAILPLDHQHAYCYATADERARSGVADERAALRERFGSWHAPIPDIIDSIDPAQVVRTDAYDLSTPLPVFHHGRVVLLGDAAHAMTPDLGQGGCQALEDAVTLGALLRNDPPIDTALQHYSTLRAPRGGDLIRRSRAAGRIYQIPVRAARTAARLAGLIPARITIRALDPVLDWHPPVDHSPHSKGDADG